MLRRSSWRRASRPRWTTRGSELGHRRCGHRAAGEPDARRVPRSAARRRRRGRGRSRSAPTAREWRATVRWPRAAAMCWRWSRTTWPCARAGCEALEAAWTRCGGRRRRDRRPAAPRVLGERPPWLVAGLDGRARPWLDLGDERVRPRPRAPTMHGGNVSFRCRCAARRGRLLARSRARRRPRLVLRRAPRPAGAGRRGWRGRYEPAAAAERLVIVAELTRARAGSPAAALRRASRRGRAAGGPTRTRRGRWRSAARARCSRATAPSGGARSARGREPRRARGRRGSSRATSSLSRRGRRFDRPSRRPARAVAAGGRVARSSCSTTASPTSARTRSGCASRRERFDAQLDVLAASGAWSRSTAGDASASRAPSPSRSTTATATTRPSPPRRSQRAGCRGRSSRRTGHVERGAAVLVGRGRPRLRRRAGPQAAAELALGPAGRAARLAHGIGRGPRRRRGRRVLAALQALDRRRDRSGGRQPCDEWARGDTGDGPPRPMSVDELRALAAAGRRRSARTRAPTAASRTRRAERPACRDAPQPRRPRALARARRRWPSPIRSASRVRTSTP